MEELAAVRSTAARLHPVHARAHKYTLLMLGDEARVEQFLTDALQDLTAQKRANHNGEIALLQALRSRILDELRQPADETTAPVSRPGRNRFWKAMHDQNDQEALSCFRALLHHLAPEDREAVVLGLFLEYVPQVAAQITRSTVDVLQARLQRACRTMETLMTADAATVPESHA